MTTVVSGGRSVRVSSAPVQQLREAVTDLTRQVEDALWVNLASDDERQGNLEDDGLQRKDLTRRIRRVRRKNPLAKLAVNLLQHYVLGQGVAVRANNKQLVARIVDEFIDNPVNRATLTSHTAMKEFLDGVYTDGEQFLVLFPDTENGTVELGTVDAIRVEDIITDPNNRKIPLWYKVSSTDRKYDYRSDTWLNGDQKVVYYRDWQNGDEKLLAPPKKKQADGLIYHVAINRRGKRGESELAAAIDWIVAHRGFMEDRATINRAAATLAWRKKRKGNAADIAAEVDRLRSTLTSSGSGYETNPPPAAGSTIVENEATTTEWIKTDTGGSAADADERKLRMMAGSGLGGIPNHYFGDEASANLATATAMELPLLKTYEDWQALMESILKDLIEFALSTAHEADRLPDKDTESRYRSARTSDHAKAIATQQEEADPTDPAEPFQLTSAEQANGGIDWYVDVDFPPIVQKDLQVFTAAVQVLGTLLPSDSLAAKKLVAEMTLTALGVNDVTEVMERVYPEGYQLPKPEPPQSLPGALSGLLGPGRRTEGEGPNGPMTEAEQLTPLAEYRVRRLLKATRDAADSLARVGD